MSRGCGGVAPAPFCAELDRGGPGCFRNISHGSKSEVFWGVLQGPEMRRSQLGSSVRVGGCSEVPFGVFLGRISSILGPALPKPMKWSSFQRRWGTLDHEIGLGMLSDRGLFFWPVEFTLVFSMRMRGSVGLSQ